MRLDTREERYLKKAANAAKYPFAVAAVNFSDDANIAYLARSLACFGGDSVHVIGKIPDNKALVKYSGSLNRFIPFYGYSKPSDFIKFIKAEGWTIVSAELTEGAVDFHTLRFDKTKKYMFVVGNESDGVPQEILTASALIAYIPMPGIGYCLNTSQTANIIFYEYAKQQT